MGVVRSGSVRLAVSLLLLTVVLPRPSQAGVLYDGALGTLPGPQGWRYQPDPPFGASATQVAERGLTVLDTTPQRTDKAGYFARLPPVFLHPGLPSFDRWSGYAVSFDVLIVTEAHVTPDRSGFSVIVLGDDLRGLELALWQDEVWAQHDAPLFTHGEGVVFDTTAAMTRYDIRVAGDRYEVHADGVFVLEGALKDYSAFGFPYTIPDFLFLGDDTTSAEATIELALVRTCTADDVVEVGDSLRIARDGADLVFGVDDVALAAGYRVYRDATPEAAGSTLHLVDTAPVLRDGASLDDGRDWYFLVTTVDDCGREAGR